MYLIESYIYRMIDFPLFTMLKEDLPKNYAITAKDI